MRCPAANYQRSRMVPARFVAEPLGAKVEWDERSRTVIILSPNYKLLGEEIMS